MYCRQEPWKHSKIPVQVDLIFYKMYLNYVSFRIRLKVVGAMIHKQNYFKLKLCLSPFKRLVLKIVHEITDCANFIFNYEIS